MNFLVSICSAIAGADRRVTEELFQPLFDYVAKLRQSADGVLPATFTVAALVTGVTGAILSGRWFASTGIAVMQTLGVLLMMIFALGFWAYGELNRNRTVPGPVSGSWAMRIFIILMLVLDILVLALMPITFTHILDAASDLFYWAAWGFGACDLKRPPPKEVKHKADVWSALPDAA